MVDDLGIDIHFVKENVIVGPQSRSADKFLHGKIKIGQCVYYHCTGAKAPCGNS